MQVTNYGLGGLCEAHVDPVGIMEVKNLKSVQKHLPVTGDMIGTFMAWLGDTEAGGATAYISPGFEGVVFPERVNIICFITQKTENISFMPLSFKPPIFLFNKGCVIIFICYWPSTSANDNAHFL